MKYSLIVVCDRNNGFVKNGSTPWHIKDDFRMFRRVTSDVKGNNVVVMGRGTYDSIGKPLKNRLNIVLSSHKIDNDDVITVSSMDILKKTLDNLGKEKKIFIIGGKSLYDEFLNKNCDELYITKVYKNYKCDKFIPKYKHILQDNYPYMYHSDLKYCKEEKVYYRFHLFTKHVVTDTTGFLYLNNDNEIQYHSTINHILKHGCLKENRTKYKTYSVFGNTMYFCLKDNYIPLITTRRMFYRGIIEELLWFMKGSTNAKELQDKNVHIWDGNTSRETLDKLGLTDYKEGDCGPIYGFNFRHYGAEYKDCNEDYTGKGVDQIKYVIDLLKNNPNSRRILINLWNPTQLNEVCLPPCHVMYQFNVTNNELSCMLTQRSSDFFLASNYNTMTAVFLVHMLCKVTNCGYTPGYIYHTMGDTHIYENHIEQCRLLTSRKPLPMPKLFINSDKEYKSMNDFEYGDFKIVGYDYYLGIKAEMAV